LGVAGREETVNESHQRSRLGRIGDGRLRPVHKECDVAKANAYELLLRCALTKKDSHFPRVSWVQALAFHLPR